MAKPVDLGAAGKNHSAQNAEEIKVSGEKSGVPVTVDDDVMPAQKSRITVPDNKNIEDRSISEKKETPDLSELELERILNKDVMDKTVLTNCLTALQQKSIKVFPQVKEKMDIYLRPHIINFPHGNSGTEEALLLALDHCITLLEKDTGFAGSLQDKKDYLMAWEGCRGLVKDHWLKGLLAAHKACLLDAFKDIDNAGEKSVVKAYGSLGISAGIVKVKGGVEVSSVLETTKDGLIHISQGKKGTGQISIGKKKIAKGSASVGVGKSEGEIFTSKEALIDYYAKKVALVAHSKLGSEKKVISSIAAHRKSSKIERKNMRELIELQEAFKALGIMGEDALKYIPEQRALPIHEERLLSEGGAGVRVAGTLGADVHIKRSKDTFIQKVPLLEQLTGNDGAIQQIVLIQT